MLNPPPPDSLFWLNLLCNMQIYLKLRSSRSASNWLLRATVGQNNSSVQMAAACHVGAAVLVHGAPSGRLDADLDERSLYLGQQSPIMIFVALLLFALEPGNEYEVAIQFPSWMLSIDTFLRGIEWAFITKYRLPKFLWHLNLLQFSKHLIDVSHVKIFLKHKVWKCLARSIEHRVFSYEIYDPSIWNS